MDKFADYNKKHCQISYLEDVDCIYLKWIGFARVGAFKEACNFSLDLLINKETSKMMADNRLGKAIPQESQNWMNDIWFPKAFQAGYRTSAVIVSEDIFNDMAVKNIVNQMDKQKFSVQYFKDLDKAKEWLKSM